MGPVQVLVVQLDPARMHGEVLAELTRLDGAGIVRLVDLLLLSRTDEGALESVELPAGLPPGLGGLTAALLGAADDVDGEDRADADDGSGPTWSLAEAVPAGAVVAVALVEHLWAQPLREAIGRAGGTPLDETWLADDDLRTLEALLGGER